MTQLDDTQLARRLADPTTRADAFRAAVQQYGEQMYWQARRLVRWHEDADDVVQNAFVKAWTHLDGFRAESTVRTWLMRIVINEALDHRRRNKHEAENDPETLAAQLQADPYFDGDATQLMLEQALQQLPPVQRTVFHLRYYDEMPYQQMSETLGTSVGALKASYHHAVKKIADFFRQHE